MMTTSAIWRSLRELRDELARVPGVVSCKIGREADMSPDAWPMVRLVPTLTDLSTRPYAVESTNVAVWVGVKQTEGEPGALEAVYEQLLALVDDVREAMRRVNLRAQNINFDRDEFQPYKACVLTIQLQSDWRVRQTGGSDINGAYPIDA